jgi:hypothetical protein
MKFHLAWLPPDTAKPPEHTDDDPAPLGFTPPWAPDISNIPLTGIRSLGFPIPNRPSPELQQLYLKFFAYPRELDARASVDKVLRPLVLDRIPGANAIARFVSDTRNVVVKRAWIAPKTFPFAADKPFPPIRLARSAHAQSDFDAHVPFSSIYVQPDADAEAGARSADAEAEATTRGVAAFHRELLETYEQSLNEIHGPEPHKFRYFLAGGPCASPPARCEITLLKVPRVPLIFRNWRELPMPQDPKHVFVSALLLVYKDELAVSPGASVAEKVATALSQAPTDRAHVFEVASVFRLRP